MEPKNQHLLVKLFVMPSLSSYAFVFYSDNYDHRYCFVFRIKFVFLFNFLHSSVIESLSFGLITFQLNNIYLITIFEGQNILNTCSNDKNMHCIGFFGYLNPPQTYFYDIQH